MIILVGPQLEYYAKFSAPHFKEGVKALARMQKDFPK